MSSLMSAALWLSRASTWLLAVFGGAAAMFAVLGVFGAASYAVVQRRRELAVRIALGAGSPALVRLLLGGALKGALAGIAAGVVLAVALGRSVSSLLVGIKPADMPTIAAVSLALAALTAVACWVPARRAARIDPMEVLRAE